MSGVPVDPVYGDGPLPGEFPYTRGIYPEMYRSRLWTMRMFAGFGTAVDTNGRFKEILRHGGTGLSTAFDMPTLMGRDSDDEVWSAGEVGRAGVAVDTLADMEDLFADIDLGSVSTSMTINGPAIVALAQYIAVADKTGVGRAALSGTIQNDILKEYQAQKEYIFPPSPSMRIITDMMQLHHRRDAPVASGVDLRLPHPRGRLDRRSGARLHVGQRLRLRGGGLKRPASTWTTSRPRLSFFFNSHSDFFEEIGKFRAARRIWATWMKGALRRGRRAQPDVPVPHPDRGRVAHRPAARDQHRPGRDYRRWPALSVAPSRCTPTPSTRRSPCPPRRQLASRLRTQQVVAHETGVANVADPLGGCGLRRVDDRRDGASRH